MARPLRIEFSGTLYHMMSRGAERRKWIEWPRRTVKTCARRERCQPRSAPPGHGPAQLGQAAERILTHSHHAYSLFTA